MLAEVSLQGGSSNPTVAVSEASLLRAYGTTKPTRAMVEQNHKFADEIDRGSGVYFVLYKGDVPDGLMFAGYSFD